LYAWTVPQNSSTGAGVIFYVFTPMLPTINSGQPEAGVAGEVFPHPIADCCPITLMLVKEMADVRMTNIAELDYEKLYWKPCTRLRVFSSSFACFLSPFGNHIESPYSHSL